MALPTQVGRYLARPINWTVEESGNDKLPTFVCSFDLFNFLGREGWQEVSDLQITGYFFLMKKDGAMNERTIKSLRDALGWDGRSINSLANSDWAGAEVQLVVGSEEYQGKTKIKVQFINPRDYEPGHIEKDPVVIQSVATRIDMQLRALAGSAPAAKPAAAKPPVNNAPMAATLAQEARKATWAAFQGKNPGVANDVLAEPWRAQIKAVFPDKVATSFTADDWKTVQQAIERPPEMAMAGGGPLGDEQFFKEDDIPF
jgi:hypothetical protein